MDVYSGDSIQLMSDRSGADGKNDASIPQLADLLIELFMFPYQLNRGKTLKNLEDVMRSRMTSEAEEGVVGKFRDWRSSNRFDKIKSEAWNKDFHMRRL